MMRGSIVYFDQFISILMPFCITFIGIFDRFIKMMFDQKKLNFEKFVILYSFWI